MDSTSIRLATPSDAIALADIYQTASGHSVEPAGYHAILASGSFPAYVAEISNSIVGFLILEIARHKAVRADSPVRLWQFYVAPEFHGKGIAPMLLGAAKDCAGEHGHDVMWLGVSENNSRAIAFYRKHGFAPVGSYEVGSGDHAHEDLVMVLDLFK